MPTDDGTGPEVHPCVVYEINEETHPKEFKRGYRFRVEDIDGDNWFFRTKERMFDQLSIHAMHPIHIEKMDKVRAKRLKK